MCMGFLSWHGPILESVNHSMPEGIQVTILSEKKTLLMWKSLKLSCWYEVRLICIIDQSYVLENGDHAAASSSVGLSQCVLTLTKRTYYQFPSLRVNFHVK